MVYTITPMVHGGQAQRWRRSFIAHLSGGALGGALTAETFRMLLSWIPNAGKSRLWVALAVVLISLLIDVRILHVRPPSPRRQVPRSWRERYSPNPTAFLYGLGLGAGVTTRVYFMSTYATFLLAAILLNQWWAPVAGAIFGIGRSSGVWVAQSATTMEALHAIVEQRGNRQKLARWVSALALAAMMAALMIGLA